MTAPRSASGEPTIRIHGDAPAIVCGECGFRTARIASVIDVHGDDAGTVVVCLPCQERERVRAASAARRAAARATAPSAGGGRPPSHPRRPTAHGNQTQIPHPR
ncbi:hypothetical protein SacxiDRAFT_0138 [Saccharomonospora xinjiangensis XJ-54]|uniref:Uncharacterized protein n=1 Tax=Saccharomonospora xinjiangensis XJ-54 TaxID=882086 RepID=I0UX18_9PSEU|nr:hypothetical protein SacxiDRAFT_0138 [Saccharomonospora xinjiangensis XJ-54]